MFTDCLAYGKKCLVFAIKAQMNLASLLGTFIASAKHIVPIENYSKNQKLFTIRKTILEHYNIILEWPHTGLTP